MRYLFATVATAALIAATCGSSLAAGNETPIIIATASAHDKGSHNHDQHQETADASATIGNLAITSAWIRAMLPGQKAGGGYLNVTNNGEAADRLIGASSPSAGKVEIHTMEVINDIMTMRPLADGLEVPAGETVELKPGGYHLMFMAVSEPFTEGTIVPVTLEFELAGKQEVTLPVRVVKGSDHDHHHDHDH